MVRANGFGLWGARARVERAKAFLWLKAFGSMQNWIQEKFGKIEQSTITLNTK
jgi:transposase